MEHQHTYQGALAASERIGWRVEDIIGGEKRLDFSKPFMPESLARVNQLSFLSPEEKRTLNQIRGHEYLAMFGLVEEFILPYVVDHTRPQLTGRRLSSSGAASVRRRRGQAHPSFQIISSRLRSRLRQQMRVYRPGRRRKEIRSVPQPAGSRYRDPAHRVDHPASLHRGCKRQPGARPAVQELAQASLARRVAAHQARYVDRRGVGGKRLRERDRPCL